MKKQDKFDAQGEIEVLGKLQHANVVKLIYTKMERNFAYMILELCLGSLRNVIRGERDGLADYEMVKLLTDTTHGFDYLVERRVYHGDIKPENVLMDTNGNYKFADFGFYRRFTKMLKGLLMWLARMNTAIRCFSSIGDNCILEQSDCSTARGCQQWSYGLSV